MPCAVGWGDRASTRPRGPTAAPTGVTPRRRRRRASSMSKADADRNVLFGLVAVQMDLISREALVAGFNAWVLRKNIPLGQVLVEQGALSAPRRDLLESLVNEHVA